MASILEPSTMLEQTTTRSLYVEPESPKDTVTITTKHYDTMEEESPRDVEIKQGRYTHYQTTFNKKDVHSDVKRARKNG